MLLSYILEEFSSFVGLSHFTIEEKNLTLFIANETSISCY